MPRENLADDSTVSQRSAWDSGLGKLWDGVTETGEASSNVNESWVQFDLGADYERFAFTIQQDNCCTWMTTHWKVQRWSASQNAWIDIMPYQAINTAAPVVYRPPADVATTSIRLYVRNSNQNGRSAYRSSTSSAKPRTRAASAAIREGRRARFRSRVHRCGQPGSCDARHRPKPEAVAAPSAQCGIRAGPAGRM